MLRKITLVTLSLVPPAGLCAQEAAPATQKLLDAVAQNHAIRFADFEAADLESLKAECLKQLELFEQAPCEDRLYKLAQSYAHAMLYESGIRAADAACASGQKIKAVSLFLGIYTELVNLNKALKAGTPLLEASPVLYNKIKERMENYWGVNIA